MATWYLFGLVVMPLITQKENCSLLKIHPSNFGAIPLLSFSCLPLASHVFPQLFFCLLDHFIAWNHLPDPWMPTYHLHPLSITWRVKLSTVFLINNDRKNKEKKMNNNEKKKRRKQEHKKKIKIRSCTHRSGFLLQLLQTRGRWRHSGVRHAHHRRHGANQVRALRKPCSVSRRRLGFIIISRMYRTEKSKDVHKLPSIKEECCVQVGVLFCINLELNFTWNVILITYIRRILPICV